RFAGLGRTAGQGSNDIVRLNALDTQDGQTLCTNDRQQWLNLRSQIVGHRGAMRLVLGEQIVAKRFSRSVEYHRDAPRLVVLHELQKHVQDAEDGARRLTTRV